MSKKQSLRIQISFKERIDDIEIYNWIEEKSSAYIKDLIVQDMLKQSKNNVVDDYKIEVNNETEDISGFDFSLED